MVVGENAQQLRRIQGLKGFVSEIQTELDSLESSLHSLQMKEKNNGKEYQQHKQTIHHLNQKFAKTYANLPSQLLPIYENEMDKNQAERQKYYLAVGGSCFFLFILFILLLWQLKHACYSGEVKA